MLLTHYAPDLPAFLLAATAPAAAPAAPAAPPAEALPADAALASAVVVDFGARAAHLAPRALAYRDLSAAADGAEAARAAREKATRRHGSVPCRLARACGLPSCVLASGPRPRLPGRRGATGSARRHAHLGAARGAAAGRTAPAPPMEHGRTTARPPGRRAAWPHGRMAAWPHGRMASGLGPLCHRRARERLAPTRVPACGAPFRRVSSSRRSAGRRSRPARARAACCCPSLAAAAAARPGGQ